MELCSGKHLSSSFLSIGRWKIAHSPASSLAAIPLLFKETKTLLQEETSLLIVQISRRLISC